VFFLFALLVAAGCVVVEEVDEVVVVEGLLLTVAVVCGRDIFDDCCVAGCSVGPSSSEMYTSLNVGFSETTQMITTSPSEPS